MYILEVLLSAFVWKPLMHNWIGLAKPKYSVFSFRLKMLQHVSYQPTQHAVTATALALHCHRDIYHVKSALGCFVFVRRTRVDVGFKFSHTMKGIYLELTSSTVTLWIRFISFNILLQSVCR